MTPTTTETILLAASDPAVVPGMGSGLTRIIDVPGAPCQ